MAGWEQLWRDPEVAGLWKDFPPDDEVVQMADRLQVQGRKRVLDIGCGVGRHTVYLAARGFQVTATDNSATAIATCRKNLAEARLAATLVEADMTSLPVPDSHFDGAIASHVIHHTDRATLGRVINLITRKLRVGGLFVWVMPSDRDSRCGRGVEVEPGTYINDEHPEGRLPHHYCSASEVRELLHAYEILSMRESESGQGDARFYHWQVLARKTAKA